MEDKEENKKDWYKKREEHWSSLEPNLKSVLGGYEDSQLPDVKCSCELLNGLILTKQLNPISCLDCAAGIGRVTEHVLSNFFKEIDLFEKNKLFIEKCKIKFSDNDKIKNIYNSSLENFEFKKKYDLIWIQWCLENLNKKDIVSFLLKCKNNLNENGIIIIKENCLLRKRKFLANDLSIQRNEKFYLSIFEKCKFKIIKKGKNENWPKEFIPLNYFILSNI
jgi:protein N-terminal methyltransferase